MNAKTSFFNKKIFTKNIIGALPLVLSVAGLIVIIGLLSINSSMQFFEYEQQPKAMQSLIVQYDFMQLSNSGLMKAVWAVYSFCCGIYIFRYLYQKKLSLTIHALPLTRTCLYLTNAMAGFVILVLPIVLSAVILGMYILVRGCGISYLPLWVLVTSAYCLFFYALSVFTAVLTGHMLAAPIIYFIFNFGVMIAEVLLRAFISIFLFGVPELEDLSKGWTMPLTPFLNFLRWLGVRYSSGNNAGIYYSNKGILLLAAYAIAALLLIAAGLLLYRKRKLELHGDPIVFKKLQSVFLYFGTAVGSAVAAYFLLAIFNQVSWGIPYNNGILLLIVFFILCSIVIYYLITMLLHKSFRVIRSHYKGIVVYCCLSLVVFLLIRLDVLGIESKIPEAADVASVSLFYEGTDIAVTSKQDIAKLQDIHKEFIEGKKELLEASYHNSSDSYFSFLSLDYTLKNGRTLTRCYYIPYAADDNTPIGDVSRRIEQKYQALLHDKELMLHNLQRARENIQSIQIGIRQEDADEEWYTYQDYYLSKREYDTLTEALKEDLQTGALQYYGNYNNWEDPEASYYLILTYSPDSYAYSLNLHYQIRSNCTHTLPVIEQLQEEYGYAGDPATADEFE